MDPVPYADWPPFVKASATTTEDGKPGWEGKLFAVRSVTMGAMFLPVTPADVGFPAGVGIGQVIIDRGVFKCGATPHFDATPMTVRWDPARGGLVVEATTTGPNPEGPAPCYGVATFIADRRQ